VRKSSRGYSILLDDGTGIWVWSCILLSVEAGELAFVDWEISILASWEIRLRSCIIGKQ